MKVRRLIFVLDLPGFSLSCVVRIAGVRKETERALRRLGACPCQHLLAVLAESDESGGDNVPPNAPRRAFEK
jgi:hypothetical protein